MSGLITTYNGEKNSIQELLEPLGVVGLAHIESDRSIAALKYESKKLFTYSNVKIKAASIEYTGIFHDLKNIVGTKEGDYHKDDQIAIGSSVNNFQVPCILAQVTSMNAVSADNNQADEFFSQITIFYNNTLEAVPYMGGYSTGVEILHIRDGKITSQNFVASSFDNNQLDLTKLINQAKLDENLSQEMAKEISEDLFAEYPILNSDSIINNQSSASIKDVILSRTYSGYKQEALDVIERVNLNSHPLYKDLFVVAALDIASKFSAAINLEHKNQNDGSVLLIERNEPLRLIYETHAEINNEKEFDNDIGGFYRTKQNLIKFEDDRAFVHEIAHAAINILFLNGAKPYPKDEGAIFNAFQEVENKVIHTLLAKFGHQMDKKVETPFLKYALKYFPETILFHKVLKEGIDDLDLFKKYEFEDILSKLGISDYEARVMAQISSLLLDYADSSFAGELIAKAAELYHDLETDEQVLNEFFSPVNEFLAKYAHPKVATMIDLHKQECLGLIDNSDGEMSLAGLNNFTFCIDEIVVS